MFKTVLLLLSLTLVLLPIFLLIWRHADHRADQALWRRLSAIQPGTPDRFQMAMVADLPEPAQRYFRFSIKAGTPLFSVAEISMTGLFSLGNKASPRYMVMKAQQILAASTGFVWKLNAGKGLIWISGSDAGMGTNSWSRFWLNGFVPVARAGGHSDHARAAYGRCIAESLFWTPAALLPRDGIRWQPVDKNTVRVIVAQADLQQAVDVTIDNEGRATAVSFMRWSNANPEKTFQLQPFGGYLSEFRWFGGFRLPTHVEAGNFFGTGAYFPFFIADVTAIEFPQTDICK